MTPDGDVEGDEAFEQALLQARNGDERGFVILWRPPTSTLLRYLRVARHRVRRGRRGRGVAARGARPGVLRGRRRRLPRLGVHHRPPPRGRRRPGAVRPAVGARRRPVDPGTRVPSAEDEAVERDATQQALALVATLPPEQAEMVMLRVVAGLDVDTVAAIVGKKPGTVRVAVHRALRSLSQGRGANR